MTKTMNAGTFSSSRRHSYSCRGRGGQALLLICIWLSLVYFDLPRDADELRFPLQQLLSKPVYNT